MPISQNQPTESIAYWNEAKCEAWHGIAEVGSLEWSRQVTEQRYFVQPHVIKFAQFDRWRDQWVLEIGCGIGSDTLQFIKAGAYIFAIDNSVESIELAIARCQAEEVDMSLVGWRSWNAEEVLPRGGFKLIYSFGVLHHTPHPEKVLRLARDVIADDGELRIMLYAKYSWKHLFTRQQPEAQAGCPLVKWYSMREAKRLVESCGFRVTSIRKTHLFPWRIEDYMQHRFVKAFPWNICPKWLFGWLESKMGHHILLVARKD